MKLSFRWYGIPTPSLWSTSAKSPAWRSIVTAVYDVKPGKVWPEESLARLEGPVRGARPGL